MLGFLSQFFDEFDWNVAPTEGKRKWNALPSCDFGDNPARLANFAASIVESVKFSEMPMRTTVRSNPKLLAVNLGYFFRAQVRPLFAQELLGINSEQLARCLNSLKIIQSKAQQPFKYIPDFKEFEVGEIPKILHRAPSGFVRETEQVIAAK